jgi:hypothetical protein
VHEDGGHVREHHTAPPLCDSLREEEHRLGLPTHAYPRWLRDRARRLELALEGLPQAAASSTSSVPPA